MRMNNIFNHIKYPIDINFHTSDLENLPPKVLYNFWTYAGTNYDKHANRRRIPPIPDRISQYLNHSTSNKVKQQLLKKLKEMIDSYEPIHTD
jgi:hypothetical protein